MDKSTGSKEPRIASAPGTGQGAPRLLRSATALRVTDSPPTLRLKTLAGPKSQPPFSLVNRRLSWIGPERSRAQSGGAYP